MRILSVFVTCAGLFAGVRSGECVAGEPPAKPAKTRLVPRPIPGEPARAAVQEDHIVRRPVDAGGGGVGGGVRGDEKARVGVIRRGSGVAVGGGAAAGDAGTDAGGDSGKRALEVRPLRPGEIRVLPRGEVQSAVAGGAAAQPEPRP